MICLHIFEDDVFMRKQLLGYYGSLGSDNLEINNNIYKIKASNAINVVNQFSYEMDNLSIVT